MDEVNDTDSILSMKTECENITTTSDVHLNTNECIKEPSVAEISRQNVQETNTYLEEGENSSKNAEKDPFVLDSVECEDDEMYTEITDDGWEDILGSGRLKKRVLKEGNKGLASEGLGRPARNDHVTISLKGTIISDIYPHACFVKSCVFPDFL